MKKLIIFVLCFMITAPAFGASARTWERRAREMHRSVVKFSVVGADRLTLSDLASYRYKCTKQVTKLVRRIRAEGDGKGFYTVRGLYLGYGFPKNHIWLEKDGVVIDPSVYNQHPDNYKETSRFEWS